MRKFRLTKSLMLLSVLVLSLVALMACSNNDSPDDPTVIPTEPTVIPTDPTQTQDEILDLIADNQKWEDASYVYAQDNGNNPLVLVEYDKGNLTNPKLTKTIEADTSSYQKLVISIKGDYFIQLNIVSLETNESTTETEDSVIINLSSEYSYYEIDLMDEYYDIYHENIIRLELIVTPGANRHFGSFSINQLELDQAALTVDSYKNEEIVPEETVYDGTSDTFDINMNWYDLGYSYTVTTDEHVIVDYAILPATNAALKTQVSGNLAMFDFINFTVLGEINTKIMFTIVTSTKEPAEILPIYEMILDGNAQDATIYLDELSDQTRNVITHILVYIDKDSLVPSIGQLEIHNAHFSNVASV